MGRIRCPHCDRKVDDGFDYCPSCGARLPHDPPEQRRSSGWGRAFGMMALCLFIVGVATVATVWLVREKDREEASRELVRHRRDSLKAAEIARLRVLREREDSMRAVAESDAERRRLESQMFTIDDFITSDASGASLRNPESTVRALRERGYSTVRRERGGRCTVMGLNVSVRGTRLAGSGDLYSAAGIWSDRVEVVFCSQEHAARFIDGARRRGFSATADTAVMRSSGSSPMVLRRISPSTFELSACR